MTKESHREAQARWRKKNPDYYERVVKPQRQAMRDRIQAYKTEKGCEVCGERRAVCLDFHHIKADKERTISQMQGYTWEKVLAEIEKCVVLCANCHRVEHS